MEIITLNTIQELFPNKNIQDIKLKKICCELINHKIIDPDDTFSEYTIDPSIVSFDFNHNIIKQKQFCMLCNNERNDINCYIVQPSLDYRETMDEMNLKIHEYGNPINYFPSCRECVDYAHLMAPETKRKIVRCSNRQICINLIKLFNRQNIKNMSRQQFQKIVQYYDKL